MNIAERIASKMPVSLVNATEDEKIESIYGVCLSLGWTPDEYYRTVMIDEDFLPDCLQAYSCRFYTGPDMSKVTADDVTMNGRFGCE